MQLAVQVYGLCFMLHTKFLPLLAIALLFAIPTKANDGDANQPDTLRIMTYNIKFLPRALFFIKHHPAKRAKLIPDSVLSQKPDVVVFEEAFDHFGVHTIIRKMKKTMPYIAGFKRGRGMLPKSSGGVLMFSKYPIVATGKTRYKQGEGVDKIGKKGAIIAEIQKGKRHIQIIGTHLQAGGSFELKSSQYNQMAELGERYQKEGVPQFYCGDFNICKRDTNLYPHMINRLKVVDGDITGSYQFTDDHVTNDMEGKYTTDKDVIDYVLYKGNGVKLKGITRFIHPFKKRWNKDHEDLSDHYPLITDVVF